jgi:predicted nucleic acid-binding protein
VNLFVDTSVWSLAWRRDRPRPSAQVKLLEQALAGDDLVVSTGLVLQELLRGFTGPKQRARILDAFLSIPLVVPDREDHVAAADLRNQCRRKGVQVGTIDGLLAQLCIRHQLQILSADADFGRIATLTPLRLARP